MQRTAWESARSYQKDATVLISHVEVGLQCENWKVKQAEDKDEVDESVDDSGLDELIC